MNKGSKSKNSSDDSKSSDEWIYYNIKVPKNGVFTGRKALWWRRGTINYNGS